MFIRLRVSTFLCIMSQQKPLTIKFTLHILSFRSSVKIFKHCGWVVPKTDVRCMINNRRHHSLAKINAHKMASCFLLFLLMVSYSMLPFVSSSSSERFNDEFKNGNATEGFISHMSRSQLGYSASQATSPTVMSNRQNEFDEVRDYSHHRAPTSQKSEG